MLIYRELPRIEDMAQRLAARIGRDGQRVVTETIPPSPEMLKRRARSLKKCHLPAEPKPQKNRPRDTGAFTPELSDMLDNDPNLSDGARRCGRKVSGYVYIRDRDAREAEITVTWLMEDLGKSRRTVQRYLRELEHGGYIAVDILRAGTRWCAGLVVRLLAPLLPRHGWPEKLIKPAMPSVSHNYKYRYKTERVPRDIWAVRCMDGVFRSLMKSLPPLPPLS
jgi:hypothetical protein